MIHIRIFFSVVKLHCPDGNHTKHPLLHRVPLLCSLVPKCNTARSKCTRVSFKLIKFCMCESTHNIHQFLNWETPFGLLTLICKIYYYYYFYSAYILCVFRCSVHLLQIPVCVWWPPMWQRHPSQFQELNM